MDHPAVLYDLFRQVGKLKDLRRTGWVAQSVEQPESVAEHSFRVTFIAMVLGDLLGLDTLKLLKLSLLHDLAEVVTGDLTPSMKIAESEKRHAERRALAELLAGLENKQIYMDLWQEYETGASDEAKLLKNIDKLEMGLQALEYMRKSRGRELYEFVDNADQAIDVEAVRAILEAARDRVTRADDGGPERP